MEDHIIRSWFAVEWVDTDFTWHRIRRNFSGSMSYLEALTCLIACRLWLPERRGTPMLMKSDSLAALRLCLTLGSKSVELNKIGCELALDHADDRYELQFLEHIPGVANTTPDGLSRMYAPIPFDGLANV